ncbi:MAG TPA: zinc-dependent alcohol dehydrogenase family protein [Acidobacteriaceae bacterium]|nr:zinc-dependent alcohol dehydrogenase family protein [Acidobacteriaceae bacterium]
MKPANMHAAVLRHPAPVRDRPLTLETVPIEEPGKDSALLKVLACGVCRTDLHIVEGELPQRLAAVIPGHQIVAEIVSSPDSKFVPGQRVGVSWIGGVDGTCRFCRSDRENLCDEPTYTGYSHNGGYAEFTTARTDFLLPLPEKLSAVAAAPLLCAGIIGFRSLRVAEVKPGMRVGLFGFGSSAQLLMQVLKAWNCEVYVSTREKRHQAIAGDRGAVWVGDALATPPQKLDAAITFAPAGDVVIAALRSLDKGSILAINAIHLDRVPQFDYDTLLWGERQIRSVTNMTREDAREFLKIAAEISLSARVQTFPLEQANEALLALKSDEVSSSAVIVP